MMKFQALKLYKLNQINSQSGIHKLNSESTDTVVTILAEPVTDQKLMNVPHAVPNHTEDYKVLYVLLTWVTMMMEVMKSQ